MPADLIHVLDKESRFSGNTKDIIEFSSQTVTVDQTWPTLDVPYLANQVGVEENLKLEPGAQLIFKDGGYVDVRDTGSLNAVGTAEAPITFTARNQTPGAWRGIQFTFSRDINNIFDHVIVEYGGGAGGNGQGNITIFGTTGLPQSLTLKNSVLRHSGSYGFDFSPAADLTGFENNIIVDNASGPGIASIDDVHYLDAQSDYSGNGSNAIVVENSSVDNDQTWRKLNADYAVTNMSLYANLTLEPGITLIFDQNGYVDIRDTGSLTAVGTDAAPITFSCSQTFAGAWRGIQFTFSNSANNKLINSVVEYAGGSGGNGDGAVVLFGSNALVSRAEIRGSTISNSETYTIWLDTGSNINNDVDTANTFVDNGTNTVFRN